MAKQEDPHPEEKPWKNQDRLPREAVDESLEMPKVRLDGNWKILGQGKVSLHGRGGIGWD